jgi:hypothetical protein
MRRTLKALLLLQHCLREKVSRRVHRRVATAAQAVCYPSFNCIVIFDPSLANFTQGTKLAHVQFSWVGTVTRLTPGPNGAATFYLALAERHDRPVCFQ